MYFSEFETTAGGTWRIAACRDYWSKFQFDAHVPPTANMQEAITAVEKALAEAEQMLGRPLRDLAVEDLDTGLLIPVVTIVTDNGGPFRSFTFVLGRILGVVAHVGVDAQDMSAALRHDSPSGAGGELEQRVIVRVIEWVKRWVLRHGTHSTARFGQLRALGYEGECASARP